MTLHTEIVASTNIDQICAKRDEAIWKFTKAAEAAEAASNLAAEADNIASSIAFFSDERRPSSDLITAVNDTERIVQKFTQALDKRAWFKLYKQTRIEDLMDKTERLEFERSLEEDAPPFTAENVRATFEHLITDSNLMFQRGLARCFSNLDRRFKSHDGFKVGSRIILTNVFDDWGCWNSRWRQQDTLEDIERVFAKLDGKPPELGKTKDIIEAERKVVGLPDARQSTAETPYFKVRCFKNGNLHLWFKRDDLVLEVNRLLAQWYGEVIGDAAPKDTSPEDVYSKTGLPSKNLSFFATPEPVVEALIRCAGGLKTRRVLEPSAGTGAIVKACLNEGAFVDAIEIHAERCAVLTSIGHPNIDVRQANFLNVTPLPVYDYVIMNPPFSGTHWIDHVTHAFEFLKPGGRLLAVLPFSAQIGETKRHRAFRAWADLRFFGWSNGWHDLPSESFKSVGTRVNTGILSLKRK